MDYADLMLEIEEFISNNGLTHSDSIENLLDGLLEAVEKE